MRPASSGLGAGDACCHHRPSAAGRPLPVAAARGTDGRLGSGGNGGVQVAADGGHDLLGAARRRAPAALAAGVCAHRWRVGTPARLRRPAEGDPVGLELALSLPASSARSRSPRARAGLLVGGCSRTLHGRVLMRYKVGAEQLQPAPTLVHRPDGCSGVRKRPGPPRSAPPMPSAPRLAPPSPPATRNRHTADGVEAELELIVREVRCRPSSAGITGSSQDPTEQGEPMNAIGSGDRSGRIFSGRRIGACAGAGVVAVVVPGRQAPGSRAASW